MDAIRTGGLPGPATRLGLAICGGLLLSMAMPARAEDANHLRDFRDKLFWKGPLMNTAASALVGEAFNWPREWGRKLDGFGMRAGSSFGKQAIQATVELGASTWTHEDLRFHRLGKGSVWRRAGHAAVGVVWVRRDNGPGNTLAAGRIAGAFTAAQIARTWMPDRLSTFHSGMASFGTSLGVQAGVGIVREFWHRKR